MLSGGCRSGAPGARARCPRRRDGWRGHRGPGAPAPPPNAGAGPIAPSCARALARFHGFVTYQPAGRYWTFQGIETGIFVALAAILLTVTAVVLLRRDAWHTAQARR